MVIFKILCNIKEAFWLFCDEMELLAAVWGYPSPENLLVLLMRSSQITDFRVGIQHEDLGTLSINNKPYCQTSVLVYLPQISFQWATPRSRCEGLEGMRMGQCFPLAGLAAASSEKRPLATSSGKRWGRGQQHPGWWRSGPPKTQTKPRARPLSGCQVSYSALWSSTWKVDLTFREIAASK